MIVRRRLDDPESREFWESVDEGARRYAEFPEWKKGGLAPWPPEDDPLWFAGVERRDGGDGERTEE